MGNWCTPARRTVSAKAKLLASGRRAKASSSYVVLRHTLYLSSRRTWPPCQKDLQQGSAGSCRLTQLR